MEKRQAQEVQQENGRDKGCDTAPTTQKNLLGPPSAITEQLADKGTNGRTLTAVNCQFGIMEKFQPRPAKPHQQLVFLIGIETFVETVSLAKSGG